MLSFSCVCSLGVRVAAKGSGHHVMLLTLPGCCSRTATQRGGLPGLLC